MRGKSWTGVAAAVLFLGAGGLRYVRLAFAANLWGANYFPNVPLITQDGTTVHLYDDLLKGKAVAINLIYTSCKDECPLETARLVQVQRLLGDRVGKDIFFYSISIDPKRDTPAVLKAYAEKFGVGPGWLFLTGNADDIKLVAKKLGLSRRERHGHAGWPPADADARQRADRPVDAELGSGQSEVPGHDDQRLHGLGAPRSPSGATRRRSSSRQTPASCSSRAGAAPAIPSARATRWGQTWQG